MREGDAFIDAVLDAPRCETTRLAFADWLEERGRAEYGLWAAEWAAAVRVAEPLTVGHSGYLAGPTLTVREYSAVLRVAEQALDLFKQDATVTVWRGFVSGVETDIESATPDRFAALFRLHPIDRVTLVDRDPWVGVGSYHWWCFPGPFMSAVAYYIPLHLFGLLSGGRPDEFYREYETGDQAADDLSNACVAWGRALAGRADRGAR